MQYFLDNYATVAEAVDAQKSFGFQIDSLILPNGFPTLVHISLSDKSGDSAVIEYTGGKAKIYHDKRFTVMTNEPTYDKQIENLKGYRSFGGDLQFIGPCKQINILIGQNNSGKSNILRFLTDYYRNVASLVTARGKFTRSDLDRHMGTATGTVKVAFGQDLDGPIFQSRLKQLGLLASDKTRPLNYVHRLLHFEEMTWANGLLWFV